MSPGPPRLGTGWFRRRPEHPRWAYGLALLIAVGSAAGFLTLVPLPHTATETYLVLIPTPTNSSIPSCESATFQHPGVYNFVWTVSNGNPTTLKVANPSGAVVYNSLTWESQPGSFSVDTTSGAYSFCAQAFSDAQVGSTPLIPVSGDLTYTYQAPEI